MIKCNHNVIKDTIHLWKSPKGEQALNSQTDQPCIWVSIGKNLVFVITGLTVRNTVFQGADTVIPVQVVTLPTVILSYYQDAVTYLVVVHFLSSQVVETESLDTA